MGTVVKEQRCLRNYRIHRYIIISFYNVVSKLLTGLKESLVILCSTCK